jgi:hypothetical protein
VRSSFVIPENSGPRGAVRCQVSGTREGTQVAKFLFIYRSKGDWSNTPSPEEMQQLLRKWQAWIAEGFQKGWMLDAGDALTKEGCVVGAGKVVTDGPFVEAKELVGGYSIIQADSLTAAAEHAKGCPGLLRGGSVEVRPLQGLTMEK